MLLEREEHALAYLIAITDVLHLLHEATASDPLHHQEHPPILLPRLQQLESELFNVKQGFMKVDEYRLPVDKLLPGRKPDKGGNFLNDMDDFVVNKTGTKLGFLFQDLVADCYGAGISSELVLRKYGGNREPLRPIDTDIIVFRAQDRILTTRLHLGHGLSPDRFCFTGALANFLSTQSQEAHLSDILLLVHRYSHRHHVGRVYEGNGTYRLCDPARRSLQMEVHSSRWTGIPVWQGVEELDHS